MEKLMDDERMETVRQWLRETPDSFPDDDPPFDWKPNFLAQRSQSYLSFASTDKCSMRSFKDLESAPEETIKQRGCFLGLFSKSKFH
jgi:hypothetical protein